METKPEPEKIPQEKLVALLNGLEDFPRVDLDGAVDQLKSSIERVLHEAATKDDSPDKHTSIKLCLEELNVALAQIKALPDRFEL